MLDAFVTVLYKMHLLMNETFFGEIVISAKMEQINLKSNVHQRIKLKTNRTCKTHKQTIKHTN